jgi:hypothetical protein
MTAWLELNMALFHPGDMFELRKVVVNSDADDALVDEFIVLEIGGQYWYWPSWGQTVDFRAATYLGGDRAEEEVLSFIWPSVSGPIDARFWYALLDPSMSYLMAEYDLIEWRYEP